MSYTYLLKLYRALDKRLLDIESARKNEADPEARHRYHEGRRDCLQFFHTYLLDTFDQKLPRRMQHKNKKQTGSR